ncbi:hypothetical protein CI610_01650 [invertebrate metagenome]|uniref:Uncharacterized protein n=1 Tax=invertebrate metagenome TaxID=1711999 RepID=A0A2H9T816_9ZZZZ
MQAKDRLYLGCYSKNNKKGSSGMPTFESWKNYVATTGQTTSVNEQQSKNIQKTGSFKGRLCEALSKVSSFFKGLLPNKTSNKPLSERTVTKVQPRSAGNKKGDQAIPDKLPGVMSSGYEKVADAMRLAPEQGTLEHYHYTLDQKRDYQKIIQLIDNSELQHARDEILGGDMALSGIYLIDAVNNFNEAVDAARNKN